MLPALTADFVRQLFDYDPLTGVITSKKTGRPVGTPNGRGHLQVWVKYKLEYGHRLAWLHYCGFLPVEQIRHKNRNKTDNRIANLELVTGWQKQLERDGYNTSFTGVEKTPSGKFIARMLRAGTRYRLGIFATPETAQLAYFLAAYAYEDGCDLNDKVRRRQLYAPRKPQDGISPLRVGK